MWQAVADTEPTLSNSPATAVSQSKLALANLGENKVQGKSNKICFRLNLRVGETELSSFLSSNSLILVPDPQRVFLS